MRLGKAGPDTSIENLPDSKSELLASLAAVSLRAPLLMPEHRAAHRGQTGLDPLAASTAAIIKEATLDISGEFQVFAVLFNRAFEYMQLGESDEYSPGRHRFEISMTQKYANLLLAAHLRYQDIAPTDYWDSAITRIVNECLKHFMPDAPEYGSVRSTSELESAFEIIEQLHERFGISDLDSHREKYRSMINGHLHKELEIAYRFDDSDREMRCRNDAKKHYVTLPSKEEYYAEWIENTLKEIETRVAALEEAATLENFHPHALRKEISQRQSSTSELQRAALIVPTARVNDRLSSFINRINEADQTNLQWKMQKTIDKTRAAISEITSGDEVPSIGRLKVLVGDLLRVTGTDRAALAQDFLNRVVEPAIREEARVAVEDPSKAGSVAVQLEALAAIRSRLCQIEGVN